MSAPEAKAKISADARPFSEASKRVEADFKRMTAAGRQSGEQIKQSSAQSASAVNNFKAKVPPTTQALQQLGQQANTTGQSLGNMGKQAQTASKDLTGTAVAVLGLGQSFSSINQTVSGFGTKIASLEKTKFGLKEMTVQLTRAEENYAKALSDRSFKSTLDQIRVEEDILRLREKIKLETASITAEQNALNGEYVNFAIQAGQTGIFGLIAIRQLFPHLTRAQVANAISMKGLGAAAQFMGFNFAAAAAQMKLVTFSLAGVKAGIRGVWLALGPIGVAIISVTLAMEAWNSNIFGIQERVRDLWDLLKKFIPVLQGLEILIQSIFPTANAELSEFDTNIKHAGTAVDGFGHSVGTASSTMSGFSSSIGGNAIALSGFSEQLGSTANAIVTFYDLASGKGIEDLQQRIDLLTSSFTYMKEQGIDPLSPAMLQAKAAMLPEINAIGKGINTAFGTDALEKFIREMRRLGAITKEEGNKIRREFDLIKESQEDLKKNFDSKDSIGKASLGASLSGSGTFLITDEGRAIDLGNVGRNISGSIERHIETLISDSLRIKKEKKSRLLDSKLGRSVRRGTIKIGSQSFTSKGRDRNPLGRNTISGKITRGFNRIREEERKRFGFDIFEATGIFPEFSGPSIRSSRDILARGGSFGAFRSNQLAAANASLTRARSAALAKIGTSRLFASEEFSFGDLIGLNQDEFSRIIQTERSLQAGFVSSGLFKAQEVAQLRKTFQGREDLENMEEFRRRRLASVGVV